MSVLYTFLQVGCADCTVLSLNSRVVMVDCHQDHEYGEFLDDHLRDGEIDLLILTHQHYDHFMGVPKLLDKGIKVHQVWESPYVRKQNDTSVSAEEWRDYQSLVTKLVEKGATRLSPECSGESVATIGGYEFYILNPAAGNNGVDSGTLHDNCLVVMAVREKEKLIFCGDASDRALKRGTPLSKKGVLSIVASK